jgi:hypothetical protein
MKIKNIRLTLNDGESEKDLNFRIAIYGRYLRFLRWKQKILNLITII